RRAAGRGAVAELASDVLAPTIGGPAGRHAARGVEAPPADGSEGEPARDRNRRRAGGRGAVAELAMRVVAPTVGGPAGRHAARGLEAPRAQSSEGEPARDRDRSEAGGGRAVADLAVRIVAPTVRGPAGRHAARKIQARAHG